LVVWKDTSIPFQVKKIKRGFTVRRKGVLVL
jgi:hypothetical protein